MMYQIFLNYSPGNQVNYVWELAYLLLNPSWWFVG